MYKINNYYFENFTCQADLHKSNYAALTNSVDKGIKYAPYANFSDEYNILKELDHQQIPKVYDIGQGNLFRDGKLLIKQNFIVLQHINGFDLVNYFKEKDVERTETIDEAITLFLTVCDPLEYLHDKNYIHCDLKPGHLILNQKTKQVFLIDFELAIKQGQVIKGISKEYASPEQLRMLSYLKNMTRDADVKSISSVIYLDGRTDIYSAGLVFYQIMTKKLWRIEKVLPRHINKYIPQKLEEVILSMLEEDVSMRIPSVRELKKALMSIIR